jgi:hypothetical protein
VVVEPPSDWRIHPAPFFVFLAATAALGGTAIWSGIDTMENPGPDAVREACAGQGEECPLYQEGQDKEVRTNGLIGGTAGAAALTVIFAIVADWDGDDDPAAAEGSGSRQRAGRPRLWVSGGNAICGQGGFLDQRLVIGLQGRY